jgi:DnaJ-class molecular chaperone
MTTPKKDYYAILEITKNATHDEILKAYKKLAVKWHPDKNLNNREEAEEKFKEISEAKNVLTDEKKRALYDNYGVCDNEGPQVDENDIFNNFPEGIFGGGIPGFKGGFSGGFSGGIPGGFSGGFPFGGIPGFGNFGGQKRPQKKIQELTINITISEIFTGCEKHIDISTNKKCENCDGYGNTDKCVNTCSVCNGSGMKVSIKRQGPIVSQQAFPCSNCNQTGKVKNKDKKCLKCDGNGIISHSTTKKITINQNFDYLTIMKLSNYGNYDTETRTNADVLIHFNIIKNHNIEIFNKYDIILEHNINIYDALTGYTMYYDHQDNNKYLFNFDHIIKHGDIKYIKHLGLPYNNDQKNNRGKLFIKFNYIYPDTILNNEKLIIWLNKNKENKENKTNKTEYKKEKIHSITKYNFDELYMKSKHHAQNSQDTSDDEQNDGKPQCVQQ